MATIPARIASQKETASPCRTESPHALSILVYVCDSCRLYLPHRKSILCPYYIAYSCLHGVPLQKAGNSRSIMATIRQHSLTESPYCRVSSGTRQDSLTESPHGPNLSLVSVCDNRLHQSLTESRLPGPVPAGNRESQKHCCLSSLGGCLRARFRRFYPPPRLPSCPSQIGHARHVLNQKLSFMIPISGRLEDNDHRR